MMSRRPVIEDDDHVRKDVRDTSFVIDVNRVTQMEKLPLDLHDSKLENLPPLSRG